MSELRVFVGGLHPGIEEADLQQLLRPVGQVQCVSFPAPRTLGDSKIFRGFAHVALRVEDTARAEALLRALNGSKWHGRVLRVAPAVPDYRARLAAEEATDNLQNEGEISSTHQQGKEDGKAAEPVRMRLPSGQVVHIAFGTTLGSRRIVFPPKAPKPLAEWLVAAQQDLVYTTAVERANALWDASTEKRMRAPPLDLAIFDRMQQLCRPLAAPNHAPPPVSHHLTSPVAHRGALVHSSSSEEEPEGGVGVVVFDSGVAEPAGAASAAPHGIRAGYASDGSISDGSEAGRGRRHGRGGGLMVPTEPQGPRVSAGAGRPGAGDREMAELVEPGSVSGDEGIDLTAGADALSALDDFGSDDAAAKNSLKSTDLADADCLIPGLMGGAVAASEGSTGSERGSGSASSASSSSSQDVDVSGGTPPTGRSEVDTGGSNEGSRRASRADRRVFTGAEPGNDGLRSGRHSSERRPSDEELESSSVCGSGSTSEGEEGAGADWEELLARASAAGSAWTAAEADAAASGSAAAASMELPKLLTPDLFLPGGAATGALASLVGSHGGPYAAGVEKTGRQSAFQDKGDASRRSHSAVVVRAWGGAAPKAGGAKGNAIGGILDSDGKELAMDDEDVVDLEAQVAAARRAHRALKPRKPRKPRQVALGDGRPDEDTKTVCIGSDTTSPPHTLREMFATPAAAALEAQRTAPSLPEAGGAVHTSATAALFADAPFALRPAPLSEGPPLDPGAGEAPKAAAAMGGAACSPTPLLTVEECKARFAPIFCPGRGAQRPGLSFGRQEELSVLDARLKAERHDLAADFRSKQRVARKRVKVATSGNR